MSQPNGSRAQSRAQSREPSQVRDGSEPEPQREQSRRGRNRSRRSPSVASTVSESGPDEVPHHSKSKRRRNKKKSGNLPAVDEVEDTGRQVASTAGGVVNKVGQAAGDGGGGGGSGDKPLKLSWT